jgi:acyl carrier protein
MLAFLKYFEVNRLSRNDPLLGETMKHQNVFDFVRDSVADLCGVPGAQITGSTDLFSLGLDSISVIELVLRLETKFGLRIQINDFHISPCINSLVEMIEARQHRDLV